MLIIGFIQFWKSKCVQSSKKIAHLKWNKRKKKLIKNCPHFSCDESSSHLDFKNTSAFDWPSLHNNNNRMLKMCLNDERKRFITTENFYSWHIILNLHYNFNQFVQINSKLRRYMTRTTTTTTKRTHYNIQNMKDH